MHYLIIFSIFFVFLSPSCRLPSGPGKAGSHCNNFQFNKEKETFVDQAGKPVSCTLADNKRIFTYIPGEGCEFWKEVYGLDENVEFAEVPIRTGSASAQLYCVLSHLIDKDSTGKVMLIANRFCFKPFPKNDREYAFISCENIYRKSSGEQKQQEKKE